MQRGARTGDHGPSPSDPADVTIVVATLGDRPSLASTVRSLLASEGIAIEVIVVDQRPGPPDPSPWLDERTVGDERLRRIVTAAAGASAARNLGIREARSEIVLLVDDDVVVEPTWARRFVDEVAADDDVAVAFCSVVAAPHDSRAGFVPDHVIDGDRTIRRGDRRDGIEGIGAGMAVRRDAVLALGGFDEALGPGAPFRAGEDRDLSNRAIALGHAVRTVGSCSVVHHGYRSFAQGRELTQRDWFGIGATYAKSLRGLDRSVARIVVVDVVVLGLLLPVARSVVRRRASGLRRAVHFAAGLRAGLATPVDRETLRYALPAERDAAGR